ncbi:MAG TPA: hypothetical protein VH092_29860 [Urbifossiella sp.]|nr:hypothetical protein [Urbifossiella sp.]
MTHRPDRRRFLAAALAGAAAPAVLGQEARGLQPGERAVDPVDLPLDRAGVWTLHFRYKPIRIMTVDGFDGRGNPAKQVAWYLWYQVYNRSGEPVYCTPEFELVTRNPPGNYLDEPQPYILDQIRRFEDRTQSPEFPNGRLNLMSSIQISRRPIPPSLPDAFPRLVSGLAIWADLPVAARRSPQLSVYVTGLSNGVATEQSRPIPPDNRIITVIKRKALRLDFFRPTDDNRPEPTDIRADVSNGPAETWLYRSSAQPRQAPGPVAEPKT